MKRMVGFNWIGVVTALVLMVPMTGWSRDNDVVAPVKGAVKAPSKKTPAKPPVTDLKAGRKAKPDAPASGTTK